MKNKTIVLLGLFMLCIVVILNVYAYFEKNNYVIYREGYQLHLYTKQNMIWKVDGKVAMCVNDLKMPPEFEYDWIVKPKNLRE